MTLAVLSSGVAVAALASRYGVGFVFLAASIPKLVGRADFEHAVSGYQLLPASWVSVVSRALPLVELVCAIGLLAGVFVPVGAGIAAVCLLMFATAAGLNLIRGRAVDCGCGGAGASRQIGWDLVIGDIGLAAAAAFVAANNVTIYEPSLPHLLAGRAPFGASTALAILLTVAIAFVLREVSSGYLRLRKTVNSFALTHGGPTE